jgi:hypothetical protein
MSISKPKLEIDGKLATELYVEHGTYEAAVRAYNAQYGTNHHNQSLQVAIKRWIIYHPVEARTLYNQDCQKYGIKLPDDAEWDTIVRRYADGILRRKPKKLAEWLEWYTSN